MRTYSEFRPTAFDVRGLSLPDRQNWLVAPCGTNRDAEALTRSNFRCMLSALGGESDTVEVHRFGHWGPGWFEIVLIDPANKDKVRIAEDIESRLDYYPILDEVDFSNEEQDEADEVWRKCYRPKDRIEYIRNHFNQFCFKGFADLLSCARGNYFHGDASYLIGHG